jgi:RNA polymerase sigma factor (sigma-70 family)
LKDDELIRRCQKGDRPAQKALYDRFQAPMFRLCYRYVREQQEAEDILCKGFFKVFENIGHFEDRGENSLQKWITRIMVNEALMFLRKHRMELVSDDQALAIPAGTRTDSAVEAEDLYNMVRALPLGYRTVFNLFAIEGFSHQEIAQQLGITEGTSKSQLSKARAMLQQMLNPNGKNNATEHRSAVS